MKAIWVIVTTLALANFLAIAGFVGWLASTGRVSRERVEAVRLIFASTVSDETKAKEEAARLAGDEAAAAAAAAKLAGAPVAAEDRLKQQQDDAEVKLQSRQRLSSDLKSLQTFLVRENERLQTWEKQLQAREATFQAEQKRINETAGSEQFKKAMATLAGVKPKEAQSILAELLAQSKQDEVISYLDAMEERVRSKVMAEFNKVDPKVAADLLERLRTRGIASAISTGSGEPAK